MQYWNTMLSKILYLLGFNVLLFFISFNDSNNIIFLQKNKSRLIAVYWRHVALQNKCIVIGLCIGLSPIWCKTIFSTNLVKFEPKYTNVLSEKMYLKMPSAKRWSYCCDQSMFLTLPTLSLADSVINLLYTSPGNCVNDHLESLSDGINHCLSRIQWPMGLLPDT